jgi:cytochrome P450
MVVPQLAARRIRALESFVGQTIEALWRHRPDGAVDWMDLVANRLPMMVVCRLIGVPDEDSDRLGAWAYASTQLLEGLLDEDALVSAGTAAVELAGYLADQLRRAVADPRDNLLGDLATACASGELDDVTAQVMMVTLFGAGGESTAALIGSATWVLASRPDLQQRLRAAPHLAGHDLTAGSRLILLWGAANRDPAQFSEADQFRLDRTNGKGHLAFGRGPHFCVGAALARMEARIVLEHLLKHTSWIELTEPARWLPSLLVRRLESLSLISTVR